MKQNKIIYLLILFVSNYPIAFGQLDSVWYQGPSIGSVNGGAIQTTDDFTAAMLSSGEDLKVNPVYYSIPKEKVSLMFEQANVKLPPYFYSEDSNAKVSDKVGNFSTVLLNSFEGIPMTNYIPPDPCIAAGPNHIIVCANSLFRIFDKQGNLLKNINAAAWWSPVWPDENGDPQVVYDHFANRWIIVWMQVNSSVQTAGNLIAYSDDDNPLGTWYLYRLDTKMHGTISSNTWGDYPKIGFDEEAIYIMTRCISFSGGLLYNKIRIINKSELYSSNGGSITYTDFWDMRTPGQGSSGALLDCINPGISYTTGNGGWFFWAMGIYGGNPVSADFYAIYRVFNPLSNPIIRGKVLPVQMYTSPPLANQLGGGLGIETIGWITKGPVIRDGYLYAAHDIQSTTNPNYSSIKYFKIDLNALSIVEQVEFGAEGYFYLFPALTVDKDHNIAITYSRSADTEYIGAYYSSRLVGDPPGLSPSQPLAEGQGNYIVTYGGGINRWGDYFGICLDPENDYNVWMVSEYAANTNIWSTFVGNIRMVPYPGVYTFYSPGKLIFSDTEVNTESEVMKFTIANYGTDDLVIQDIASDVGPFTRVSVHNFPVTLQTYDSIMVEIIFSPTQAGDYDELLAVTSNDPLFTGLELIGHSYNMVEAYTDLFYVSTGSGSNGDILLVDKETGEGTELGNSLFNEVKRLAVNPTNNLLYGIVSNLSETELVRVNAEQGDAYTLFTLDLPSLSGIAFDNNGLLFVAGQTGDIYTVDLTNGDFNFVATASININAIAFHQTTNQLWASLFKAVGSGRDFIYTIDLVTGDATIVGSTGFGMMTNDLAFDENNKLYGVIGTPSVSGKLIEINTIDGTGTEIGDIGFNHVTGLGYSLYGPVNSIDEEIILPKEFSLKQNYPNPFNPSTVIEYTVPKQSDVKLVVYNLLGQKVLTLVDEAKSAGNYNVSLNAGSLTAGIYFYRLQTGIFDQTKKMILIK